MMDACAEIPNSAPYPLADALALMENVRRDGKPERYFTSSLDYIIAAAILEKPEEIWLIGFDMATDTEYRYQREGLAFWVGMAAGRGIVIRYPAEATVLYSRLYAWENAQQVEAERLEAILADKRPELAKLDASRIAAQATQDTEEEVQAYLNLEWRYHTLAGLVSTAEKLLANVFTAQGQRFLSRQQIEHVNAGVNLERQEALAQMNFWRGVVSDREKNGANDESMFEAIGEMHQRQARFHGLDGACQLAQALVREIDGQEARYLDALVNVGGK
jgi:hypothetical protein